MHVEAMNWSGMGLQAYACAHGISRYSLRRSRDLIDVNEVQVDWRTHVHPPKNKQRPADGAAAEQRLTASPISDPPSGGRANRRCFTDEESSRS